MSQYKKGDTLIIVKTVQRSAGAAWPDDKVKVVAVEGDGLKVRTEDGALLDLVKDSDVRPA